MNSNQILILSVFLGYLLFNIVVSFVYSRRAEKSLHTTSEKKYFIGGRNMNGIVLAMTIMATYTSASSFISGPGAAGLTYGYAQAWICGSFRSSGRRCRRFRRRRLVSDAIRKTEAYSAALGTPSKSSQSWSHGRSKMPLKRRTPCAHAAMACRGAQHFRSIVLTTGTRPRLRGWFSAGRISFPAGWRAERISGIIRR